MTPQRQMIVAAVIAIALMLILVATNFLPRGGSAPSPSSSPTSTPVAVEEQPSGSEPDAEPSASSAPTFHGHSCSPDCEEMRSGYSYALDNNVKNDGDCAGAQNSEQFAEGCRIYVYDQTGGSP